jgi:hypothetical protein
MSLSKIYKADVGRKFRLDSETDISAASVARLKYTKPDATTGYWDGSIEDSRYVFYITQLATDLDQVGKWRIQMYLEINGADLHGNIEDFHVYKRLEDY